MTQTTLEEATELITDGTHGSPERTENPNGIPLLSAKNIFDGEVRWNHFDSVPPSELEEFQKRVRLTKGDVLMTCVGSIGRAAVWSDERPVVFFRSVAIIRPKPTLLPKYLEYVIRSGQFQQELRRRIKRSSQGGVYLKDIKTMPIIVPLVAEQERIVKLLDQADGLRKLRAQADSRTAEIIHGLFHEMFGDPIANPRDWRRETLGNLLEGIDGGWSPICQDRRAETSEWGVLKLGAVTTCEYIQTENKALFEDFAPRPALEVKTGDLLFTRKNTYELVAACAFVFETRPKLMFSDLIFRFRLKASSQLNPVFLWGLLTARNKRRQVQSLASGAAGSMPNISRARLLTLLIEVPPLPLQEKFARRVAQIRELEAKQADSRKRLNALFQSMLHRAFQGEL